MEARTLVGYRTGVLVFREWRCCEELAAAEGRLAEIAASLEAAESGVPAGGGGPSPRAEAAAARPTGTGVSPARHSSPAGRGRSPRTAVAAARLRAINEGLLTVPPGFTIHPKLARQIDRRRGALDRGGRIDWAQAEAVALGSLLLEGTPIRAFGLGCRISSATTDRDSPTDSPVDRLRSPAAVPLYAIHPRPAQVAGGRAAHRCHPHDPRDGGPAIAPRPPRPERSARP